MILDTLDTEKRYELILVDPPWPQTKSVKRVRPNQTKEFPYTTMDLETLETYQKKICSLAGEKCNLFLWAIDKFLPQAEDMMKRIGWKLHARMIWDKVTGVPSAYTIRYCHEYLLWFYQKGQMYPVDREVQGKYSTVFREKSTFHSHKPEIVYLMLENMFPSASKLEVYARNTREGWDSFGDELPTDGSRILSRADGRTADGPSDPDVPRTGYENA